MITYSFQLLYYLNTKCDLRPSTEYFESRIIAKYPIHELV